MLVSWRGGGVTDSAMSYVLGPIKSGVADYLLILTMTPDHPTLTSTACSPRERTQLLGAIVHSADLAGQTKPWVLCKEWTARVMNEFFREVCTSVCVCVPRPGAG